MAGELNRYSSLFRDYTELRLHRNSARSVMLVNGDVLGNRSWSAGGISARVWHRGVWGFASGADASDDGVERIVRYASTNARYLAGRGDRTLGDLPVTVAKAENVFDTPHTRRTNRQVIDFVKDLDDRIAAAHPQLQSRTLILASLDMQKRLLTSQGSSAVSMIPRTLLISILSVERDGEPFELLEVFGGFGQFEDNFTTPEALEAGMADEVEHLMRKSEAVYARAGHRECILDARLAGILAHEAIGHTTEADLVLGGSVAGDQVGQPVATDLVSLTDFANTAFGERCPVPLYVDDEGTAGQDVPIIVDGILQGFMHNKETALRFGVAPTGNARAYAFSDEPLIRMRNTTFLPGTSKLDEMIASIDDGYYLVRPSNGQADSTSEFMFGVVLGYEIKNGKLGRAIRDTTISGIAFDVLKTVSMVSDEVHWECGGMCGKKQMIPVGMGGPAIRCTVHIGGQ